MPLVLKPLNRWIDPNVSNFIVGKVQVKVWLIQHVQGGRSTLGGDNPGPLSAAPIASTSFALAASIGVRKPKKNWEETASTLDSFQKIYGNADGDTRWAMMKGYQESGGKTLGTN
ncbi:hypothetical protein CVT25_013804 [Psilocybe cyanescens]|uniref:SGS domain-containing protein n=1 Tax=Psilocybe cyanescens TaxID=93625 RepID=A0A409XUI2_PSICY|nr:hypothetical protein CVT25_013804 [Psilocybe cyanescens]